MQQYESFSRFLIPDDSPVALGCGKITRQARGTACRSSSRSFVTAVKIQPANIVTLLFGGPMRSLFVICSSVLLSAIVIASAQEPQQPPARPKNPIPDRFVNLQVLPKDIKKPQLVGIMKQFCITFNVRCLHCHSVSDDLTQGSFDSDEKETKQKARELFKLIYAAQPHSQTDKR
jgi:hypothetical protein